MKTLPEFISVQEAARRLDFDASTIYKAIRDGELRTERVKNRVRIPVTEFVAWVDSITTSR